MLREEFLTLKAGAYLFHGGGFIMMPFISPGVPLGTERLRCNVTAAHSEAEMGYALEAVAEIGKMLDILPKSADTGRPAWQKALWFAQHGVEGTRNAGVGHLTKQFELHAKEPLQKLASDIWRAARPSTAKDGWSDVEASGAGALGEAAVAPDEAQLWAEAFASLGTVSTTIAMATAIATAIAMAIAITTAMATATAIASATATAIATARGIAMPDARPSRCPSTSSSTTRRRCSCWP